MIEYEQYDGAFNYDIGLRNYYRLILQKFAGRRENKFQNLKGETDTEILLCH